MRRLLYLLAPIAVAGGLLAFRHQAAAPACDPGNGGLILPPGFCATLFASNVSNVRNLAVAPNGDVFAGGQNGRRGVTVFRDRDHDGHSDTTVTFGQNYGSGTGIALGTDAIYFSPNGSVVRFAWKPGSLMPSDSGTVIVSGLPVGGNHNAKTLALSKDGSLYVDHGSATNSCQESDRKPHVAGKNPCVELDIRGGTWRYDANKTGQTPSLAKRWATGIRNGEAIAVDPATGILWGAINGRDQLGDNWGFSPEDNAEKPAEEFGMIAKGADYGWPYCYYDPLSKKKVQAPEYGGDGVKQGDCAAKTQPVIAFPGHWAPLQLAFVPRNNSFGAAFGEGAFLAFHGSWNRAPLPQAGYRIVFIPFKGGKATGEYSTFATMGGDYTQFRASGVAFAPDGSALYIGSDAGGKIWRVVRTTTK